MATPGRVIIAARASLCRFDERQGIAMEYSPREAADALGIGPSTLRKWSVEFGALLSPGAKEALSPGGGPAYRRYTESDIAILTRAKALMSRGSTYQEARRGLAEPEEPTSLALQDSGLLAMVERHYTELLTTKNQTIDALERLSRTQEQRITDLEAKLEQARRQWIKATLTRRKT